MSSRIEYFDVIRGIAIIFVVGIHTFNNNCIENWGSIATNVNIFLRQIIGCAVPLFIAASGYFMWRADVSTDKAYWNFEKKQIPRVYVPYLIWALPTFLLAVAAGNSVVWNIVNYIFCGYGIYYFIILIIQFYLLLPLMKKLAVKKSGLYISFFISLAAAAIYYYLQYGLGISLRVLFTSGPFPLWLIFFVLGLWFGNGNKLRIPVKYLITGWMILLVYSYFETVWLIEKYNYILSVGNNKFSWLLYSVTSILLLFSLRDKYKTNGFFRIIALLGRYSFGIYLIHKYFINYIVMRFFPEMNWILMIPVVLVLCVIFMYVAKKILPEFSKRYLGF